MFNYIFAIVDFILLVFGVFLLKTEKQVFLLFYFCLNLLIKLNSKLKENTCAIKYYDMYSICCFFNIFLSFSLLLYLILFYRRLSFFLTN